MKSISRLFRSSLRHATTSPQGGRRTLMFEAMEERRVLSADLGLGNLDFDDHDHDDVHLDASGFELHALTDLPDAADPVNPQDTLSTYTPVNLSETFLLNSNPAAEHTLFLDFDGHVTSGTVWNSSFNGGSDIVTPAFDFDGNVTAFSNAELERIQWIWERVAEDFIPFDINVTTQDPGTAALIKSGSSDSAGAARVVIGGSSSDWYGNAAGGVAYVGSFNWGSDTPTFVFEAQLGNGNEKYTAEAITHEAGHTLGLSHDGRTNPSEGYYQGHGSGETGWAPIMGAGYYKNVTQWSKGEYAYASQTQDDLAIITGNNGFSYRADDHGSTNNSASALGISNETISDWGIIERSTDVDVFALTTNAGTLTIDVNPLNRGPNLDVLLELYDSSNNLVASSNPSELLSAGITVTATAQQYFLHVSGTGKGNPLSDGYSDYASLGQYFVSGTVVPVQNDFLAIAASSANKSEGNSGTTNFTFNVSRSGNTSGSTTVNYAVAGSGSAPATASDFSGGNMPSGSVSFAPGETSKTITLLIAGDGEVEDDESFTVTLSGATGDTVISTAIAVGVIVNDDAVQVPGITVTPTSGLTTRENGSTASFTVVLDSQPTANVTIQVRSLDTTEGSVSTSQLTFTTGNWNAAQTVIVTGLDDTLTDGNVNYTVELVAAQSSDAQYNNRNADDVQVTNQDDEAVVKGKKGGGKTDGGGGSKGGGKGRKAAVPEFPSDKDNATSGSAVASHVSVVQVISLPSPVVGGASSENIRKDEVEQLTPDIHPMIGELAGVVVDVEWQELVESRERPAANSHPHHLENTDVAIGELEAELVIDLPWLAT